MAARRRTPADVLQVGAYSIARGKPTPSIPRGFEVPASARKTWPHHIVELIEPSRAEWVRTIEARGVSVVEPLGRRALFVIGDPKHVAALRALRFVFAVTAFAPAYRLGPDMTARKGRIRFVSIGVAGEHALPEVRQAVLAAGGTVASEYEGPRPPYRVVVAELDASHLARIARLPDVRWIEYRPAEHTPLDEWSAQIIANHFDPKITEISIPLPGYPESLAELGLSGAGTLIGIVDTGADTNDAASMHPDLKGRFAFFADVTGGQIPVDGWTIQVPDKDGNLVTKLDGGHGTLVAGIAVGDAATGVRSSEGFLLGQGVAPGATFGMINGVAPGGAKPFKVYSQLVSQHGGTVMNNSWHDSIGQGYTADTALVDGAARDADPSSDSPLPLAIVFAASNKGPGSHTVGQPNDAKNVITVGATMCFLGPDTGCVAQIWTSSSRGPASDGRLLPTIVAPGTGVVGTRSLVDANPATPGVQPPKPAVFDAFVGGTYEQYTYGEGTSFAAPHVAGMCALLTQWWAQRSGGRKPSPAMLKALLVNGADDLGAAPRILADVVLESTAQPGIQKLEGLGFLPTFVFQVLTNFGGPLIKREVTVLPQKSSVDEILADDEGWFYDAAIDTLFSRTTFVSILHPQAFARVPNNDQGWGRANLPNIVLQGEGASRGPRIFSDQRHAFTASGQEFVMRVAASDTQRPLRITLVWTDPPAAANASPALVNNLDLNVVDGLVPPPKTYRGNAFANGFSVEGKGSAFDARNNVECVYVEKPSGIYDIHVIAASVVADARPPFSMQTPWQDFALVVENAVLAAPSPVSVVTVLDRSESMATSGYDAITRTSARQFIDHLLPDDAVGCVSFGQEGTVDYPAPPAKAVQLVAGATELEAAKAAVDAVTFGGCTNMGEGLLEAQALLANAAASRAIVLFSDGYDNKGCDPFNTKKPWAKTVAEKLPEDLRVYTCAMGPASDQALLGGIAATTGGVYYYMPSIDDLFEISGYIRGQISGDSVVANEIGFASQSKVGAFVDRSASRARFSVAWADSRVRFVAREPKAFGDLAVRLRTPGGQLLHPRTSALRMIEAAGYVIFDVDDPQPGGWSIEVETPEGTHVQYTASAFVTSPIRLDVTARGGKVLGAAPSIAVWAQVIDGQDAVAVTHADTRVVSPVASLATLLSTHRQRLKKISTPAGGDAMPLDVARLLALRDQDLRAGRGDLFAHREAALRLSPDRSGTASRGSFTGVRGAASYNIKVTVSGTSPRTGGRFVRVGLASVWARARNSTSQRLNR